MAPRLTMDNLGIWLHRDQHDQAPTRVPDSAHVVIERMPDGQVVAQVVLQPGEVEVDAAEVAVEFGAGGMRQVVEGWLDRLDPDSLTAASMGGGMGQSTGAKILDALRAQAARL